MSTSKNLHFWQVDAFTDQPFKGNPAAIVVTDEALSDDRMQAIATEMNVPETAFILLQDNLNAHLRWFTPTYEIDLCGHATLASAHILLSELQRGINEVVFETKSAGPLHVAMTAEGYLMNFPVRIGNRIEIDAIPSFVLDSLSIMRPVAAYQARDLMLVYEDEPTIWSMNPDFGTLKKYRDAIIVTAKGKNAAYDFVSRFFCASEPIPEDPVTGSAHCTLAPYWAERLGKNNLLAHQASLRGGDLRVELKGNRVLISGKAVTTLDGRIKV